MNSLLQTLTHDEVTQRVGLTLAHAVWQGFAVALLLALVLRGMRTEAAARRHAVACVALLILLVAPIVTFWRLDGALPPIENATGSGSNTEVLPGGMLGRFTSASFVQTGDAIPTANVETTPVKESSMIPWHAWAVAAWLAGMVGLTLWHGLGWIQLQRLRRRDVIPWEDEFALLAGRMAKRLGLGAMPRVLWSKRVVGPVAFGCWRPVVLMPMSLATGFTMAQIEMILAHEFAHLRRHDYLINLCQTAAATLLFYHPAVWWINQVIRREREHACDDLAAAAVKDSVGYARALIALAEQELTEGPALATAAVSGKGTLKRRVERLLYPLPSRPALRFWPAMFAVIVGALAWQMPPSQPSVVHGIEIDPGEEVVRGNIRDRNGVLLATDDNEHVEVWFRLRDVAIAYAEAHDGEFPRRKRQSKAADKALKEITAPDDREVPDIVSMFNELIIEKLDAAGLARPYNATQLRSIYQGEVWLPSAIPPDQVRSVLSAYGQNAWCYRSDLTLEEEQRFRGMAAQLPGMSIHTVRSRRYPFNALASHVLGYVNPGKDPLGTSAYGASIGVYGVEKTQDESLRPFLAKDGASPHRGSDVYLTLDARHQTVVELTLRTATPAIGRASAVLMEVDTGDVLAMASVPSFDPNDFVPSISRAKFEEYNSNKTHPLLNRAVRAFIPGSTFMVATSVAAICSGHEDEQFDCKGGVTYGTKYFQCWISQKGEAHGLFDMREAIVASCGPYFFQLGNTVPMPVFETTASLCGLGRHTGIELNEEASGIFPGATWWSTNRRREPFTAGTVANLSIGQGAVETTPLQLASLMGTVANGGTVWRPRLVDRVAPGDDVANAQARPRIRSADLRKHGLTESGLGKLRGALEDIVHAPDARAKAAQSPSIRIAGTTGTAQNWRTAEGQAVKDNHTWFICYAPAEKPRWALAVLVQGGKGGGVSAAPIARHILEQVSAIETGALKMEPQAVPPVQGSFDAVEEVVLPTFNPTE